jgi:hypothetical protein
MTTGEAATPATENRYAVREEEGERGWDVVVVDPSGEEVWRRACRSASEAHVFASTVRQHVYWLSEEKFREYYRLGEPGA